MLGKKLQKGGILRFIFIDKYLCSSFISEYYCFIDKLAKLTFLPEFSLLIRPWVNQQRVLPTLPRIQWYVQYASSFVWVIDSTQKCWTWENETEVLGGETFG